MEHKNAHDCGHVSFKNDEIRRVFRDLGFPANIIYKLVTAKLLGVVVLLIGKPKKRVGMAYIGFLFSFLLAAGCRLNVGNRDYCIAIVVLASLLTYDT